ncbi:3'-5' exonuclease [Clostridium culturomicium]|uniref:3'-5' exonuclease n=1 Tax=Clostridium culturomicium TaxID=1499683 RepID=UPI0038578155
MKLLFFDTETTSIKPGNICQLSYIIVDTSTKPQTTIGKNFFFTVEEMSEGAEAIHGFSLEKLYDLSNGLYFEDTYEEFIEDFLSCDVIIGHNVQFDIKFMKSELEFLDIDFSPKHVFCTMAYYKNICKALTAKGMLKNPSLGEVINFLRLDEKFLQDKCTSLFGESAGYHDARYDTTCTYMTVIQGIKTGLIPPKYFTAMVEG